MKKVFFILGVLLSLGVFCACNNDDDIETDISGGDLKSETDSVLDRMQISFSLLNENDIPTTVFQYGEDICFRLTIENNNEYNVFFEEDIKFNDGLFRVYSEDGTDMGTPWTSCNTEFVCIGISANSTVSLSCNWIKALSTQEPLVKNKDYSPLPKGNYYTKFQIKHRDFDSKFQDIFLEKEFNITFTIQ
jgi:hypothetical protein